MKAVFQALVKFQSQLKPVEKGAENPFYKSSYADLSSILQAITPELTSCGLGIIQPMRVTESGTILITKIIHESGESIESEMFLPGHQDPQKYGSLISYYKRYQLQAMLGISTIDEDDDANKASGKDFKQQPHSYSRPAQERPTFSIEKKVEANTQAGQPQPNKPDSQPGSLSVASDAQKKFLTKLGIYYSNDITKSEASKLIENANKNKQEGK